MGQKLQKPKFGSHRRSGKKMDKQLQEALQASHVEIIEQSKKDFRAFKNPSRWLESPIWRSWATKLDESDLCYFLPDMHRALVHLTGENVEYIAARTKNGAITMYLVGFHEGHQPMGPFWNDKFDSLLTDDNISDCAGRILKFGRGLQRDLNTDRRSDLWSQSFEDSYRYLTIHRKCVRLVGRALEVDMEDHDLTKSRVVQIALGYMWHWVGDKEDSEEERELTDLGRDAIKAGHLELENHHPEYRGQLEVEVEKLFADRVAVHLQKDGPDDCKGWYMNPRYLPDQYKDAWEEFHNKHKDKDLNKTVWDRVVEEFGLRQEQAHTQEAGVASGT